jgi:hypothetical protein
MTEHRKNRRLDRVTDAIRRKHDSLRTEKARAGWIRRIILFYDRRYPADKGADKSEEYLTHSLSRWPTQREQVAGEAGGTVRAATGVRRRRNAPRSYDSWMDKGDRHWLRACLRKLAARLTTPAYIALLLTSLHSDPCQVPVTLSVRIVTLGNAAEELDRSSSISYKHGVTEASVRHRQEGGTPTMPLQLCWFRLAKGLILP